MDMKEFITELVKAHHVKGIRIPEGAGLGGMEGSIVNEVFDSVKDQLDSATKGEIARSVITDRLPLSYTRICELTK